MLWTALQPRGSGKLSQRWRRAWVRRSGALVGPRRAPELSDGQRVCWSHLSWGNRHPSCYFPVSLRSLAFLRSPAEPSLSASFASFRYGRRDGGGGSFIHRLDVPPRRSGPMVDDPPGGRRFWTRARGSAHLTLALCSAGRLSDHRHHTDCDGDQDCLGDGNRKRFRKRALRHDVPQTEVASAA